MHNDDSEMDDQRLSALLGTRPERTDSAVLIGFPSDAGVRINGGRPGAAQAPPQIREGFGRLTPDARDFERFVDAISRCRDIGDLSVTGDVARDQEGLGVVVADQLEAGSIPIVIGGGHETAYGHFLGYVKAGLDVSIVNVDAHPDVRPLRDGKAHSGSPFRQALLDPAGRCQSYVVAGLQPPSAAGAHLAFIRDRGGRWLWSNEVTGPGIAALFDHLKGNVMVSMDMDAVSAAWAPGVSAPSPCGLLPDVWLHAAFHAGACPTVRSLDLVEVNPAFDADGRTMRLAALTLWHFFSGLATRRTETDARNG